MANTKITDLSAYADPLSTDVLPIVDITTNTTKKVSISTLLKAVPAGTSGAPGIAFDGFGASTGIYQPTFDQFAIVTFGSEGLRITGDQVLAYNQSTPAAVNATATLTVANLKAGIITSTSAAATDMTLPTGTFTEAGFSSPYTNMAFQWSVINTGPSLVRVLAGTAHTLVGSGSIATGTSGRFSSRRTAANTFVTYRLS
jgi:hypothetical protein